MSAAFSYIPSKNSYEDAGDPYRLLAVRIFEQTAADIAALDGQDSTFFMSQRITRYEILNFLRSKWCFALAGGLDLQREQIRYLEDKLYV